MAGWLRRPRCQGLTVAQPPNRTRLSRATASKMRLGNVDMALNLVRSTALRWPLSQGRLRMQVAVLALISLAGSACVGNGVGVPAPPESGSAVPRTWPEIQSLILEPHCAQLCHHGGASPKGLSLESAVALQNLVGVASSELPSMQRVAPGHPENSYLIVKLAPSDMRRVGSRMPRTGPPFLTGGQVDALRRWITAGATKDWKADAADAGPTVVSGPDVDAGSQPDAQEEP